jgi:hypothetical protein
MASRSEPEPATALSPKFVTVKVAASADAGEHHSPPSNASDWIERRQE